MRQHIDAILLRAIVMLNELNTTPAASIAENVIVSEPEAHPSSTANATVPVAPTFKAISLARGETIKAPA